MAGQRTPATPELRLLRCGLRCLADVPQLRAPEGRRLRLLQLHGNTLASLQGLDAVCPSLEELTVSSNDLQSLEGLQLQHLRILDISCNCLTNLAGLETLSQLQELRVAYNQIGQLSELASFAKPSQLRLLDLRDNGITQLGQLLFLGGFPLEDLRFQSAGGRRGNPICRLPGYRSAVLQTAPDLQYLDEEMLDGHEKEELPPPARMVPPEGWPPRPERTAEPQASTFEARQQLFQLREARQEQLQAVAQSKAAYQAAQAGLAREGLRKEPPISQQVQQELKLVAAEAKRRQAMNRELKAKLSQTLQQLQKTQDSERMLRLQLKQLKGRSQLAQLKQQEASMEALSFQAAFSVAQNELEEDAATRSQEIVEADSLLAELQEETQALAAATLELHQRQRGQLILKDELQGKRQELECWTREFIPLAEGKLQRGRSRCLSEAAAAEAARAQDAMELLAQHVAFKALETEDMSRELEQSQAELRSLEFQGEERRLMLEQEVGNAELELKEMQVQQEVQQQKKVAEQETMEKGFKERYGSLVLEAKTLQAEMQELRSKTVAEDSALRRYSEATEESQSEEMLLEDALRRAHGQEMAVQEQLVAEDAAFKRAQDALQLAKAELKEEEEHLQGLQASFRRDFVPAQLLEEEEQFVHSLKQEEALAHEQLRRIEQEEQEAAESLMSSKPQRIRDELTEMQVRVRSVTLEFKQADVEMDAMQQQIQSLQGEAASQHDARSKRDVDWQRADAEVQRRVQNALAEEEVAADAAVALQEELDGLKQELEHYDEDMHFLEETVEEATEAWSMVPFAQVEDLEAQNLRSARQAEEQLSSLGLALSKELQKHREANQSVSRLLESEQQQLEGYLREEKQMQDAWNKERQALAEEAATVASELQRLATGL